MNQDDENNENKNVEQPRNIFDELRTQHHQSDSNFSEEEHDPLFEASDDQKQDVVVNNGMPHEARRALVSLLRYGVILAVKKAKLFESTCRYQSDIRQHLADVYLKLMLDEKAGVAFVISIPEEEFDDEEPVSLITHRTLTLYDTLLLLVLRKHYQERERSGEQRIVIDIERVESYLTPFLSLTNSTKADRKKLGVALKKMVEKRLLSVERGSEGRFEITPIIRYVVSAEFLESMLDEYLKIASENDINLSEEDSHA